jgi:hypothetical protein
MHMPARPALLAAKQRHARRQRRPHPSAATRPQADASALAFGLVACGFSHECQFVLRNASTMPARYAWRAVCAPSEPADSTGVLQARLPELGLAGRLREAPARRSGGCRICA